MSRELGITAILSDLPSVVIIAFALITQLADFWFVFAATALAYWLGPLTPRLGRGLTRERAAMVLALLAGAIALTVSLKAAFGLPRPPGAGMAAEATLVPAAVRDIYVSMATGDGFGFPSGHATVGTLVWGGFAWALRVGSRSQRVAVAATAITLVCLSRLVLGVHYLVDVVAGAAIAGGFLWLGVAKLRTPGRVFAAASVVALGGLLVSGLSQDIGAAVGMSLGGTTAWYALPTVPAPTGRGAVITIGFGAVSVGVLAGAALLVLSDGIAILGFAAVGTALLLALPLVGERVAKKA